MKVGGSERGCSPREQAHAEEKLPPLGLVWAVLQEGSAAERTRLSGRDRVAVKTRLKRLDMW